MKASKSPQPDSILNSRSLAALIAAEFGRLYRDGRGSIGDICRAEDEQIDAFLHMSRAQVIRALLPSLWPCSLGGYGAFVMGRGHQQTVHVCDDFEHFRIKDLEAQWRVRDIHKDAPQAGVAALMSFLAYGRDVDGADVARLLGVAAARVLLGKGGAA